MTRRRRRSPESTGQDAQRVLEALEDLIAETHMFPDAGAIRARADLSDSRVDDAIESLAQAGRLATVFSREKVITLYAPKYMVDELLRLQPKPLWVAEHAFAERGELEKQIEKAREQLTRDDLLERLLYGTGVPLQEAVASALEELGFEGVVHHTERTDYADASFEWEGNKCLVEVKGKAGQADKDDVLQLEGWIRVELESGTDPDQVTGILAINHFRHVDPTKRSDPPLTAEGERFRKRYGFLLVTTPLLFDLVKNLDEGSLTKEKARKTVLTGEENL